MGKLMICSGCLPKANVSIEALIDFVYIKDDFAPSFERMLGDVLNRLGRRTYLNI